MTHASKNVSVKSTLYDMAKKQNPIRQFLSILALFVILPSPIFAHGIEQAINGALILTLVFNVVGFLLSIIINWRSFKLFGKFYLLAIFLLQNMINFPMFIVLWFFVDRRSEPNSLTALFVAWPAAWGLTLVIINVIAIILANRLMRQKEANSQKT